MLSIKRHHTRITSLDNYNLQRKMMELKITFHPRAMMRQASLQQVLILDRIRMCSHEIYSVKLQLVRILTTTIFSMRMMRQVEALLK
ncbi:hypothetical protein D3C81_1894670 [compost metagenome]